MSTLGGAEERTAWPQNSVTRLVRIAVGLGGSSLLLSGCVSHEELLVVNSCEMSIDVVVSSDGPESAGPNPIVTLRSAPGQHSYLYPYEETEADVLLLWVRESPSENWPSDPIAVVAADHPSEDADVEFDVSGRECPRGG